MLPAQTAENAFWKTKKISLPDEIKRVSGYAMHRREVEAGNLKYAAEAERWSWGGGVLMYGLLRAHEVNEDPRILEFIRHWIDYHYRKGFHLNHTDRIMPAGVVSEMILDGDLPEKYRPVLDLSYEFMTKGRHQAKGCPDENGKRPMVKLAFRGRSWLDDLFMNGQFMARYAMLTKDSKLMHDVGKQILAHIEILQCHGGDSKMLNHGQWLGPKGRPFFPSGKVAWARANGWYLSAITDYLALTPNKWTEHRQILVHFQEIMSEVPRYQRADGLFPTVLDRPDSYGEVAATALYVQAAAAGLRQKWLRAEIYYDLVYKGLLAILDNLSPDGQVLQTSGGTPVLPWGKLYERIRIGTYPWGEGTVMMALVEIHRLVEELRTFEEMDLSEGQIEFLARFSE